LQSENHLPDITNEVVSTALTLRKQLPYPLKIPKSISQKHNEDSLFDLPPGGRALILLAQMISQENSFDKCSHQILLPCLDKIWLNLSFFSSTNKKFII
jgi:hypothetical protein